MPYHELGADYFDRRNRERTVRRHVKQLEALGYTVTLGEAASGVAFSEQIRRSGDQKIVKNLLIS